MLNKLLELVVGKKHKESDTRLEQAHKDNLMASDQARAQAVETGAAAQESKEKSQEACTCMECERSAGKLPCVEKSGLNLDTARPA